VVYEQQHKDAVMLMENENHVVEHPMDVDEYNKYVETNYELALTRLLKNSILTLELSIYATVAFVLFIPF